MFLALGFFYSNDSGAPVIWKYKEMKTHVVQVQMHLLIEIFPYEKD